MEYNIGYRYEKLIIIKIYINDKNRKTVDCRCDCGNIHTTLLSCFKLGRSKNCAECGKKIRLEKLRKFYKEKSYINHHNFNGYGDIPLCLYNQYKANAERRKIQFNIDIQYLQKIYLEQNKKCYFTDIELALDKKNCNASLDRIDSKKGYEIDNLIWIYKPINFMKTDIEITEFIRLCCLIYDHLNG